MTSTLLKVYLTLSLVALRVAAIPLNVTSVGVIGTGCPPGTSSVDVDRVDGKVRVRIQGYKAEAGPGVPISYGRRNCRITLGYAIAAEKTLVKARISADADVRLSANNAYYCDPSQVEQGQGGTTIVGPTRGEAILTNIISPLVWSPCGEPTIVNLSNDLRVVNTDNRAGTGSIVLDDLYEATFVWRQCGEIPPPVPEQPEEPEPEDPEDPTPEEPTPEEPTPEEPTPEDPTPEEPEEPTPEPENPTPEPEDPTPEPEDPEPEQPEEPTPERPEEPEQPAPERPEEPEEPAPERPEEPEQPVPERPDEPEVEA
ncbi:hypothetical protein CC1G_07204 [Coprinopsis cinerea okayama7|uniref:Uncharacterized protein n=1 Tax=Coprinopsis cinerea (strain Okayama-7 / 130 / ATCC MYA-4618 / FGSC 9003) TaxID=240176 RepID=A8PCW1_COPC7|nr:hypothetical protein CC1G_07204 [Coprinopsis cinerea okayama7\|eukprot:XP_001840474.2 hypothetical protein CC1G_07204 [Coprinopsis cinerea okayama7\